MSEPRSVSLIRAANFSAAHRYFDPNLSVETNQETFGSLYRDQGFGHNFRLEAEFTGAIDPMTGMIANLKDIDSWIRDVVRELDHKHLNKIEAFKDTAPTPERIAIYCFTEIKKRATCTLKRVRIFEDDNYWVDTYG